VLKIKNDDKKYHEIPKARQSINNNDGQLMN